MAVVVSVVLLVLYGRHVVFGLLLALAVVAGTVVVGVLLWLLVSLALPGQRWAVHASPSEVLARLRELAGRVRRGVAAAPWRDQEAVVAAVAEQVDGKVAELPGGRVAYSHLTVQLHPDTIARLDEWMAIEEVASCWARAYAEHHEDTPRTEHKVTVVVASADRLPIGRAEVSAAFREIVPGTAVALARWPLAGPWVGAGPAAGQHTMLRMDGLGEGAPPPGGRGGGNPGPGAGEAGRGGVPVREGTDPVAASGSAGAPDGVGTSNRAGADPGRDTTRLDGGPVGGDADDATVRLVPGRGGSGPVPPSTTVLGPQPTGRDDRAGRFADQVLTLVRLNPATGQPAAGDPLLVRGPRARIGRAHDQDVRLSPIHVSRVHAEIKRVRGGWVVTDLHSTRGTYRNNERIPAGLPHALAAGDTVEFGRSPNGAQSTLFRVHG